MEQGMPRGSTRSSTGAITPFRRGIIRRVDTELKKVDPSGRISREPTQQSLPDVSLVSMKEPKNTGNAPPLIKDTSKAPTGLESKRPDTKTGYTSTTPGEVLTLADGQVDFAGVSQTALPDTPPRTPRLVGFDLPTVTIASSIQEITQPRSSNLRQRRTISAPQRSMTWSEIDIRES
jgi:hypothetical protein